MDTPYVLDTTTTDNYKYLACPEATRVTIQVSNAAVLIGFGTAGVGQYFKPGSGEYPAQDEPFLPTIGGLARDCDEIRVKSYTPGAAADVKITAR